MKPLLVFDLDGTLIDSAADIADAVNATLTRYGHSEVPFDVVVSHIGEGLRKLIGDFFPEKHRHPELLRRIEWEFLQTYEEKMFNQTRLYPGVLDFLRSWKGPIGIITNKNEAPAKALIRHLGLYQFPWIRIFGADSLPEKKPSPLPLQTMMTLAQRGAEQTLMIGDGTPDMLSAQKAGVRSVAIGFGYTAPDILQQYQPAALLEHYTQLGKLIEGLGFSS